MLYSSLSEKGNRLERSQRSSALLEKMTKGRATGYLSYDRHAIALIFSPTFSNFS